jgi:hypothetical protein
MPIISAQDAQYALDLVKKICTEAGPGLPGTPQERERAGIIKNELGVLLGMENVSEEEFELAPAAFLSTYPGVMCMVLAVVLNIYTGLGSGVSPWITSIAALVFSIIAPLMFILEFLLSLEIFDPLFRKVQSINVIGRLRKPGTRQVKRLLILSGHHDSAPENTWLRYTGFGFYILSALYFIELVLMIVMNLIQLAGLILGSASIFRMGTVGWVLVIFVILPAIIYVTFLTRGWKNGGIVPGAADNLSACATAVAACRFLVQNPSCIPDETEIRFITFGSEGGLRLTALRKRHLEEFAAAGCA